jgi:hypothetical protein
VILRLAALAAGQTDTWIGRFYRRKRAHLGAPKALTATAHKLACVIYHMLKYQEEFVPLDVVLYEFKAQERRNDEKNQLRVTSISGQSCCSVVYFDSPNTRKLRKKPRLACRGLFAGLLSWKPGLERSGL